MDAGEWWDEWIADLNAVDAELQEPRERPWEYVLGPEEVEG